MSIQIESDPGEVLEKIEKKFDQMDRKFERIDQKLDSLENKFEQKLDTLQKDVTGINLRLTKVETSLDGAMADIKEIKSSQQGQIWALIGILITAVGGFLVAVVTVGRFVFSANPIGFELGV